MSKGVKSDLMSDLCSIISVVPPTVMSMYRVQLVWDSNQNRDVGFRFSRLDLESQLEAVPVDLELRDFNIKFDGGNQSRDDGEMEATEEVTKVGVTEEVSKVEITEEVHEVIEKVDVFREEGIVRSLVGLGSRECEEDNQWDQTKYMDSMKPEKKTKEVHLVPCEVCHLPVIRRAYQRHLRVAHMFPKIRCDKCDKEKYSLRFHVCTVRTQDRICLFCGKNQTKVNFSRHLNICRIEQLRIKGGIKLEK